jgi:hypothetical protein
MNTLEVNNAELAVARLQALIAKDEATYATLAIGDYSHNVARSPWEIFFLGGTVGSVATLVWGMVGGPNYLMFAAVPLLLVFGYVYTAITGKRLAVTEAEQRDDLAFLAEELDRNRASLQRYQDLLRREDNARRKPAGA